MKAFITGIAGFVGRHLLEHLLACGDEVLGSVHSPSDAADGSRELRLQALVEWDLANRTLPAGSDRRTLENFAPDCIYHLAAVSVPKQCGDEQPTDEAWAVNVDGTRRVLSFAASLPSRPRVIVISSSHVYAPPRVGYRVNEAAPLEPTTGYGQTKLAAEQAAWQAVREFRLEVIVVRAFQHAGPGQRGPMMLPQWVRQFIEGEGPVSVYNLDAFVDLCDVRDVVRAYRLLAEQGISGVAYNVGSGSRQRTGDIFAILHQMADPNRDVVETHPGAMHNLIADVARLSGRTGWRPQIPIVRTVSDTFAYWRNGMSARI